MNVMMFLPPEHARGWPGTYLVNLDYTGGFDKWDHVRLTALGGSYVLFPTPWQLVALAALMVRLRAGRWLRRLSFGGVW